VFQILASSSAGERERAARSLARLEILVALARSSKIK